MNSKNGKQDFNNRPLYFETLNETKKPGLQTVFTYPRAYKTAASLNKLSLQQKTLEVQTPFYLDEF